MRIHYKLSDYKQVKMIRERSDVACSMIKDKLHFINIDGDHHRKQVSRDLANYEPLMAEGALFSGHDYYGEKNADEVRKAVDQYAKEKGRDLKTIEDGINMWWWYIPRVR